MNPMHTQHRSHARRDARGFTLLEVMLSVVIIGLGVLGLSAIFAGAASQQVASARTTEAAALITRVEQIIRDRSGAPSVGYGVNVPPNVGEQLPVTAGQYEGGLDFPMTPTAWYPLSAYEERDSDGYPSHAVTLAPSIDPTQNALGLFFLNSAPGIEIYYNPLDVTADLVGSFAAPVYHPRNASGVPDPWPTTPRMVRYVVNGPQAQGEDGANAVHDEPFWGVRPDGSGVSLVQPLPHARLHPGSLRVRFEIARKDAANNSAAIVARRTLVFDDSSLFDDGDDFGFVDGDPDMNITGLTAAHGYPVLPPDMPVPYNRVLFDRVPIPDPALPPTAELLEFDIALAPYEWIERIVVEPYQWRSETLLTLSERVRPSLDNSSLGVATLMQGPFAGSGRKIAVIAYLAEPVDRQIEWIPPESALANDRLLRREQVFLGYDVQLRAHYVRVTDTADAWITEPGQILLFAGDPDGNPATVITEAGSDTFSRVTRQFRRTPTDFRGVLDVGPRSAGTPLLPPEDNSSEIPLDVWVLHPVAESLAPEAGSFRITPVDASIINSR